MTKPKSIFASLAGGALFVAATAAPASADLLVGRVVDSFGVGVPNVNIDIDNLGSGGDPTISDDTTDLNGNFAVIVPPGLYDVFFFPPKPPTTTHLTATVESVGVVGTVDLGDVVLPPGYGLQGRFVDPIGLPIVGADLDVEDLTTGLDLLLTGDNTDAFGNFVLAVPQGPFELELDATGVLGQVLVSFGGEYDLAGNTDLGTLALEPGALVTGQVVGPGGVPVVGADIDVVRSDGTKVVTPKDNTGVGGVFTVTAPFDVVDVQVCPVAGQLLAGSEVAGFDVTGPSSVGVIAMAAGVQLSGTVTTFDGQLAGGTDIDLMDPVSGLPVFVCNDSTKPDGTYSLLAPAGTYDVVFEPTSFQIPLGSTTIAGVALGAPTVVDGVLPACPFPTEFGVGTPGSGGFAPHLSSVGGTPRVDNSDFGLVLDNLAGGAPGALAIGFVQVALPLFGGTVYVNPGGPLVSFPFLASGPAGVPGVGSATFPIPVQASYAGIFFVAQAYAVDLGAPGFLVLSDAVSATFCP